MKLRIKVIIVVGVLACILFFALNRKYSESFDNKSEDKHNTGSTQYNINNYDLKFHDSAEDIQAQDSKSSILYDTVIITDAKGNKRKISRDKTQGSIIYYEPDLYKYGTDAFVPTYEESILLSKTYGIYPRVFELPTTIPPKTTPISNDDIGTDKNNEK